MIDETMPAGRSLDLRIATEVFGEEWTKHDAVWINDRRYDVVTWLPADADPHSPPAGSYAGENRIPHYSTDIADAWLVVEKMKASAFEVTIDDTDGDWWALFADLEYKHISSAYADTAPLALCRAALKAVGA